MAMLPPWRSYWREGGGEARAGGGGARGGGRTHALAAPWRRCSARTPTQHSTPRGAPPARPQHTGRRSPAPLVRVPAARRLPRGGRAPPARPSSLRARCTPAAAAPPRPAGKRARRARAAAAPPRCSASAPCAAEVEGEGRSAEDWPLMSVSEREEEGVILSIRIYSTRRTSDTGPKSSPNVYNGVSQTCAEL